MAKIVISELDIDINALIKSTAEVKNAIDVIKTQQKELTKSGETASNQFVQNAADLKTLGGAYNSNLKAISDSTNATADQANRTQLLSLALSTEVTTIKEARDQNALLNRLRNDTNATTAEGQAQITALNAKLDQNNEFVKENADQYLKQKINIGNYASALEGVDGILAQFGINGQQARTVVSGFTSTVSSAGNDLVKFSNSAIQATASTLGFKTSAQLAAQTQATQTVATEVQTEANVALAGTTVGLTAVTNASTIGLRAFTVALASTGIGLIVIAVGALFAYFKDLDPLLDKIEQGTAAVGAAFRFLGQALASLSFDNLIGGMTEAASAAANLKEAQQELQDLQNTQEVANARASQQYDELILKSKNRTLTEEQRIAFLKEAEKIETANYNQRINLANADLKLAIESARIKGQLSDQELGKLQRNTLAYGTYLLNSGKITQEELDGLKKAELGKIAIDSEATKRLEKNQNAQDKLFEDKKTRDEKAQADAEAQSKAEIERQQKVLDNAVKISQAELDLYIESQGTKAKTLEQGLKISQDIYAKQLEINQKEFNASEKTEVDKLELKRKNLEAINTLNEEQTTLAIANAETELQRFIENNQSKIDNNKFLTDAIVAEEKTRIEALKQEQLDFAQFQLSNGAITEQQLIDEKKRINDEAKIKQDELDAQKKQADAEAKIIDLENQKLSDNASFEQKLIESQAKLERERQQELLNADKTGSDKTLINAKYEAQKLALTKATKDAELSLTASTLGQIRGLLKENTVVARALAIGEATINTYLGATKALATLPPPYGAIQAGVTIATGVAQVAKIAGVQFAGGGFIEAQGASHAQGGIPITIGGQNFGTMQGGEGLAIMNKGAFSHFKAFNNTFGDSDVSSSGFYAGGGIITQGVTSKGVDTTSLVNGMMEVIASMPPPQVAITDINYGQNNYAEIVEGANF
jgi:hypothetical protein